MVKIPKIYTFFPKLSNKNAMSNPPAEQNSSPEILDVDQSSFSANVDDTGLASTTQNETNAKNIQLLVTWMGSKMWGFAQKTPNSAVELVRFGIKTWEVVMQEDHLIYHRNKLMRITRLKKPQIYTKMKMKSAIILIGCL